nr:hypothetical protein [uncultured bacterium]
MFRRESAQFGKLIGLNHRQVVEREESLCHEVLGQFIGDTGNLRKCCDGAFQALVEFFLRHDVNVPPDKLRGEANILPLLADSQRELIFSDQHDDLTQHRAEDHVFDLGRLQGVGNEDLQGVVPSHDIDSFAGQFIDDALDARAANADAGTDAIDLAVEAGDRDFRTISGFARQRPDFDNVFGNFGNFDFEQPPHEFWMRARQDDSNPAALLADVEDCGPHALADAVCFARNLFAAGKDTLDLAEVDRCGATFNACDDARHNLAAHRLEFFEQGVAFGLANLLNHHLLGGLGGDASQQVADLFRFEVVLVDFDRRFAAFAIDIDEHFALFAEVLPRSREYGLFDPLEHDVLINILVAMDGINDSQEFRAVHNLPFEPTLPDAGTPSRVGSLRQTTAETSAGFVPQVPTSKPSNLENQPPPNKKAGGKSHFTSTVARRATAQPRAANAARNSAGIVSAMRSDLCFPTRLHHY